MQAIPQCAGHDDPVQSGALVGHHVVVGDAALHTVILGIGSGVDCPDGYDKAQSIGRCDIPSTPATRKLNIILGSNESCIGLSQAMPTEGRNIGADKGLQASVACFRREYCADAGGKITSPGFRLAHMGERVDKARARMDFEQHLGKLHIGQPRFHFAAQSNEAVRLFKLVEAGQHHFSVRLETHMSIIGKVRSNPPVRRIELSTQLGYFFVSRL